MTFPSVSKNFLWALLSNLLNGATGWATFVVLARVGTPEMVGQYTLGLAVVTPLALLTDLHLRATLGTDLQGQFDFRDYLGLRLLSNGGLLLAASVFVLAVGYTAGTGLVVLAVALAKAAESVIDLYYGLLQQRERMDRVARSLAVRGPLSLLVLAGVTLTTGSVAWGVVGLFLVRLLVLLGHDVHAAERTRRSTPAARAFVQVCPRWQPRVLGQLAWLTLPLGFVLMLIALNTSIPVFCVESFCGPRDVGFFGVLLSLAGAGSLVPAAAGQAVSPALARSYAAGDLVAFRGRLRTLLLGGLLLGGVAVVAALLLGRAFLAWTYGPGYADRKEVLLWLLAAFTLEWLASFLGWGILATRRFRRYPLPYLITTAVVGAASVVLVPRFGLVGAAWAIGAANATSFLVLFVLLATVLRQSQSAQRALCPAAIDNHRSHVLPD